MKNSIIHGDCLEVMKDIPDKSIDCIIADLPYGMTVCKWDTVIPFEPLWEQYKRIIKPNSAIVLFGSQPFTSALIMSNPKWFRYEWIWEKNYGSNFACLKYMPSREHENILVFGKGKLNYYPIRIPRTESSLKREPKGTTRQFVNKAWANKKCELTNVTILRYRKPFDADGMKNPRTILKFNRNIHADKRHHPTQKPTTLLEYLIKTYTQEGELILDNTAGSGSLAIAAINTNRRYICIEQDANYFNIMKERIANHVPNAPAKKAKVKPVPHGQLSLFD